LENDRWREVAKTGYAHVMKYHTWRTRAGQLRMMLGEVLGL